MLALAGPSLGMTWNTAVRRSSLRATGTAAVTLSMPRRMSATSSCLACGLGLAQAGGEVAHHHDRAGHAFAEAAAGDVIGLERLRLDRLGPAVGQREPELAGRQRHDAQQQDAGQQRQDRVPGDESAPAVAAAVFVPGAVLALMARGGVVLLRLGPGAPGDQLPADQGQHGRGQGQGDDDGDRHRCGGGQAHDGQEREVPG